MDYKELQDILSSLDYASYKLEETFAENEGEVTEETDLLEAEVSALKTLLNTEGVDYLGRWLKGKEDKRKAIKAEMDYLKRQAAAIDETIAFIKAKISEVMRATGCEKVKGSLGYTFATYTSEKTTVEMDNIEFDYLDEVTEAARNAGLPEFCDVAIVTNATRIKEYFEAHGVAPAYLKTTTSETVRFTKPRANKE